MLVVAALIAPAMPLVTLVQPAAATGTLVEGSVDYVCSPVVRTIDGTRIETSEIFYSARLGFHLGFPTIHRNSTVEGITVGVDLTIDPLLRQVVAGDEVRARYISPELRGVSIGLSQIFTEDDHFVRGLSVKDQPIEQDAERPWTTSLAGELGPVSFYEGEQVPLLGPRTFRAVATLKNKGRATVGQLRMDCRLAGFDSTRVFGRAPTEPPLNRTAPVIDPRLLDDPVVQGVTKARIEVRSDLPQNKSVSVQAEDGRQLDFGFTDQDGRAVLDLPVFGRSGVRALTVTYDGDDDRLPASTGIDVVVAPRVAPEIAARVRTDPVLAGSTRATLSVRTDARPQATGAVSVRTEDGRTIATGPLDANGDVLITLPPFSKRGARTVTVVYPGDTFHRAVVTGASFRVR